MRSFKLHPGPCEVCSRHVESGAYWVTPYKVLDFGVPTMAPIEPDMTEPRRCDNCELLHRLADPQYRVLCGTAAAKMESEAIANGGIKS